MLLPLGRTKNVPLVVFLCYDCCWENLVVGKTSKNAVVAFKSIKPETMRRAVVFNTRFQVRMHVHIRRDYPSVFRQIVIEEHQLVEVEQL